MTRAEKIVGIGLLLLMCGIMAVLQNCDGTSKNEREARVAHRLHLGAMRFEQIAEEPEVQLIILDNQDFLRHGITHL